MSPIRSPGSALKPFVYALALEQGLIHPRTVLEDAPARFRGYDPENFDGRFMGPLSATDALTWIKGSHTMKTGFLITRNRKDANGRPPLTGNITFNPSGNAKSTGNAMADALVGVFRIAQEPSCPAVTDAGSSAITRLPSAIFMAQ